MDEQVSSVSRKPEPPPGFNIVMLKSVATADRYKVGCTLCGAVMHMIVPWQDLVGQEPWLVAQRMLDKLCADHKHNSCRQRRYRCKGASF